MHHFLKTLWYEEEGAVISSELVMLSTVLVIGMMAGLNAVHTAVVTEMSDLAGGMGGLNQSFSIGGIRSPGAETAGHVFFDRTEGVDEGIQRTGFQQQRNPACIEIGSTLFGPG